MFNQNIQLFHFQKMKKFDITIKKFLRKKMYYIIMSKKTNEVKKLLTNYLFR